MKQKQILMGNRLRKMREERNLTQMQLAELTDMSDRAISNIETGKANPHLDHMILIASALGISLNHLVSDAVSEQKEEYISEIINSVYDWTEDELKHLLRYIDFYRKEKTYLK